MAAAWKSGLIALLPLAIISMASSSAAKKLKTKDVGSKQKRFLDLFKRLNKPGNASATQLNLPMVSISSPSPSDRDPDPGNDTGNAEPTASGEYGSVILASSTTIQPLQSETVPQQTQPTLQTLPPYSVQLHHQAFLI